MAHYFVAINILNDGLNDIVSMIIHLLDDLVPAGMIVCQFFCKIVTAPFRIW